MICHILLGNCNTCRNDLETTENEEEERILSFRPDILDEFHPRLGHVAVEFAWLLEESLYLYKEIDFAYVYRYASPRMKFEIRRAGRRCWTDQNILSGKYETEFEQKRLEIRRRLQLGYRRGPIMSRLMANLRWEGQRRQHTTASKIQSSSDSSVSLPSVSPPSPSSTPILADEITDTVLIPSTKETCTMMTKSSSISESPVKILTKKRRVTMASEGSLQSLKVPAILSKPNSHLPSTTPTDSLSPALNSDPPSLPQSNILTSLESEVAWLVEESLLANPFDGPLLSFVQDNASYKLHSYLCSSSISDRRWLPRLHRSHDVDVSREFAHYRLLIRKTLQEGYRRTETKHLLPSEYTPPPLLTRVQQVYHQAFVRTKVSKLPPYSSRTKAIRSHPKPICSTVTLS